MKDLVFYKKMLLSFFIIVACSCQSDNVSSSCSFSLDDKKISSVEANSLASEMKVFVSADDNWSLRSDCDWCTVTPSSGVALSLGHTKAIKINVVDNPQKENRTANIILTSGGSTANLEVIQQGSYEDESGWENASIAVRNMKVGWNLGNTLDVNRTDVAASVDPSAFETYWGQPITTKEMIDKFKEAGFNAIRVPVTWGIHLDADDNIVESWMDRVEEIVNYVLDDDMYCIINIHHDSGSGDRWLKADINQYPNISVKFKKIWQQIAMRFQKYDEHLIFEGYNEMLDNDDKWTEPTDDASYDAVNKLAQDFVTTVRETGGNNINRNLCVNTYSASYSERTLSHFVMPVDQVKNHLIAQVHMYTTYNFAQNTQSPEKIFTSEIKQSIVDGMSAINTRFCSKGIPVVIGEFGAVDKNNEEERAKHAACIVSEAKKYGIVCFRWMGLLDRTTLQWNETLIKDAIINSVQ